MTTLSDLKIFSDRIGSPYEAEPDRIRATRYYAATIHELPDLSRTQQRAAIEQIADDLEKFILVASDPSESKPLRILTMGMAMGDTLSNLSYACRQQRRSTSALLTSQAAFNQASLLGREASVRIEFTKLMEAAIEIAETPDEDIHIRKGAIILFNKILKIGVASCHQTLDRARYVERFIDIAVNTDDKALKLCAVKIGASGSEPHSYSTPYLSLT